MEYDAVVGFSVNPELELKVVKTEGPKKLLESIDCCLSGASGNVASSFYKLGVPRSHLLGLIAVDHLKETLADTLLNEVVNRIKVSFTPIRVLTQTNICVIPVIENTNGVAWGKRYPVVRSAVPKALHDLAGPEIGIGLKTFSVVTSLRLVEIVFAKTLLARTHVGFRVLNAQKALCARKEFKKILSLVDLLVLNQREFNETGMKLAELHSCGPRIVVVTHDKEGGMFSFYSGYCNRFRPVDFPGGKFETGAGDWFLGAVVSELIRIRKSVLTVHHMQFAEVINFAARVAGKKITIPGGGNGPTRSQLR